MTKYIFNLKVKVMTVKQTSEAMRTIQNILAAEYRFYPAYVASTRTHTYTHALGREFRRVIVTKEPVC